MQFSRPRESTPALGALEIAVLRALWASNEPLEARAVADGLAERRITLSTVQATLERLHRKGLLTRVKVSRAYRYASAVTQARLIGILIRGLTQQIAEGELEPTISGFVDLIGDSQPELLERLRAEANDKIRKDRK